MTQIANKRVRQLVRALAGGGKTLAALEASFFGTPSALTLVTAAHTAKDGEVIPVDTTAAAVTVTLPAPTAGSVVYVKHVAGVNNLVLARNNGADTINGAAANITDTTAGDVFRLFADGTGWRAY